MPWTSMPQNEQVPGPPKGPKIMAQHPKIESIGSIGSIILPILEVQVCQNAKVASLTAPDPVNRPTNTHILGALAFHPTSHSRTGC